MVYIPSIIKTGIEAIMRFGIGNLKSHNAGITDGRNL
jgi:hypothetical protein